MAQLHGVIVMSVAGAVVWVGWLNKLNGVPLAKLCNTVASFFKREGGHQNSSYLDAGTFAAASTTDGENIISVVCSLSCPETEVGPRASPQPCAAPTAPLSYYTGHRSTL